MKIYQLLFLICFSNYSISFSQVTANSNQTTVINIISKSPTRDNIQSCNLSNSSIKHGEYTNILFNPNNGSNMLHNPTLRECSSFNYYKSIIIDTTNEMGSRKYFLSFNLGFLEAIGMGLGYQYSNSWGFTGKISVQNREQNVLAVSGIAVRIARYFTTALIFNNISLQPTVILFNKENQKYKLGMKGFSFEAGIGNESIKSSELNFFWSVGGIISVVRKEKPLFSPSLKLGLNWNF